MNSSQGRLRCSPFPQKLDSQGELEIAGSKLSTLAKEYDTPLYIYDAATVKEQISISKAFALQTLWRKCFDRLCHQSLFFAFFCSKIDTTWVSALT